MCSLKSSLSPARLRLLEEMQNLNFGRIEALAVHNGEPVFDFPPRIIREIKFCAENGPRRELGVEDFALKAQVVELFEQLSQLDEGMVECLEIKHGLPFRMKIVETARA